MANLISLSQLFTNSVFRIPDYQRGYAWENEQLDDFWQDLNNLMPTTLHYTGMISKKEIDKVDCQWLLNDNFKAYHIVDGQQRLTTCIIFINELIKLASKVNYADLNGEKIEDIKEKYILKQKKTLTAYLFGYEFDNPSFDYFKYEILGYATSSKLDESFYTLKMKETKDFFAEKIEKLSKSQLDELYKKLTNNLMFIDYDISNNFDVYTVFEVMNDRGKPLSNLEKFKNRLIYLTTVFSDECCDQFEKADLRDAINKAWKEIYKQLGHSKEKLLNDDDYLKNHWILYYKYSRKRGDDYIKFLLHEKYKFLSVKKYNELVAQGKNPDESCVTPTEMKDYVKSLENTAQYWFFSHYPDDAFLTDDEKEYIRKLNRIGFVGFRPLVVASMANKNVKPDERLELLKSIERFIFIVYRMGKANSTYLTSEVNSRAKLLFECTEKIENITNYINNKVKDLIPWCLTKFTIKVEENVQRDGYYTNKDFLKYFFFEYELDSASVTKITDWKYFTSEEKDKISIEHICPQTPTKWYWRNQFRGYTPEEIEIFTGSLGNLLPLSQKINSSLQNDEFDDKKNGKNGRRGYCNGSHSELEVAKYKDWNPYAIKERGLELLEFMEKRWNFQFNPNDKLKLLGIEFINDGRIIPPPIAKPKQTARNNQIVSHLNDKKPEVVCLYDAMIEKLQETLPAIEEVITKAYIAIKNDSGENITEIRIQAEQIKINIYKPLKEENQIGQYEKDSINWVHNYYILLKKAEQIDRVVEAILDSNSQN